MKILSNVTMAGNVSMAGNAKDQFTIGSELERDNANADELKVWANSNFYNDVTLGSSSVDIVNIKGQLTSSQGLATSGSIFLNGQNSTIYLGPNDWVDYVDTSLNQLKPVETTGSGVSLIYDDDVSKTYLRSLQSDQDRINITSYNNNTEILVGLAPQRYDYSVLTSATGTIGTNNTENSEVHYINNLGNSGLSWTLPSVQSYVTRVITIKNISSQYNITVNASGSQTIDGAASLTLPPNKSYTLQAIDNSGYKWHILSQNPEIDGAWSSYNVAWTSNGTQPSLGNGTLTGYYKQIGKTVFVRVELNWGSTTTGGTGDWRFSLPVSAVAPAAIQMPCSILDNGNAWYQATVNGTYSGLTDRTSLIGQSANANSSQAITSTFPITWGNTDSLQFNGSYEAA